MDPSKTPKDIAKFITEDIRTNNGLMIPGDREEIPGDREELDWQTDIPRQYGMLTMNSDETPMLLSQLIKGVNDTIRNRTEYFGSEDKIVVDKIETGAGGDAIAIGSFNGKPFEYNFDGIDTPFAALPEEIEIYLDIRR